MVNNYSSSASFHDLLLASGISPGFVAQCALKARFVVREPRKISPLALLDALCEQSIHGTASYNDVAAALDAHGAPRPSRQAVANRVNPALLLLCEKLLAHAIAHKIGAHHGPKLTGLLGSFGRVLVQDSTILKLPAWLFDSFSGVTNAHSTVCNARIQALYDLASMSFLAFSIDSYSRNDLAAAPSLDIQAGDLVLRDRGYLTADEIARHIDLGAHCIYRHKTGTVFLDPDTGLPIDLFHKLEKWGSIDMPVLLHNEQRTRVRLVAAPVDEETAALRRMKAKKSLIT